MGNWNADSVQVSDSDGSDSEADADDLAAVFHQVEFFGKSWRRRFFSRFPALQAVWAKSVDYDRLESSEPKRITHFLEVFKRFWPRSNHRLLAAAATPFSSASAVTMSTISPA